MTNLVLIAVISTLVITSGIALWTVWDLAKRKERLMNDDMNDMNANTLWGINAEKSPWKCYMFGGTPASQGLIWMPNKGCEPNWFWRKMQWLILGNLWVKENTND